MAKLVLYNYFRSSTSYRARIALNLKKLSYEYIPVHLLNDGGEQNKPEYRKISPGGEVPTLSVDEKNISQSMAIIEYLDEQFADPKLFSGDSFKRAKIRQVCEHINSGIHPITNLKVLQYLEKQLHQDSDARTAWTKFWIRQGLENLEKLIQPLAGNFSIGDEVTAADIFIIPALFGAARFSVDYSDLSTIVRVEKNCLQLDAFKKAHPYCQPDTPAELRGSP